MAKFKLGIIGAGGIGNHHADSALALGLDVAAIADVNLEAAQNTANSKGIVIACSPEDLIANKDITAVVIGVPNKFHKPLAIAAMKAGKDVLVEKPMALNVAECKQMIATAKKTKRILQIGFVQHYSAVATTAKQFIDAGKLGDVYHIKANYYRRRGIPGLGGWFTTKALSGGGPLIDLGVHIIDLALFLMDYPKPLRASGKVYAKFGPRMKNYVHEAMWAGPPRLKGTCDVEDSAHALIRLENGATMEINTTWAGNFPDDSVNNLMGFFGDRGGMTFQLNGDKVQIACEEQGHNVDITPKLRTVNNFQEQARDFAANCAKRKQPISTGERGMLTQAILDAIYKSSAQDKEVAINL